MNKIYKKWFFNVITIVLCIYGLNMVLNYIVDPYNVFDSNIMARYSNPNERFMKISFLEKNHTKFNSYLFGSSRIGTTNPRLIEKYIPGSSFYNFTACSSNLYDNLKHIKYFMKRKYKVKNLYIQIDPTQNMSTYIYNPSDYLRKYHPYVEDKNLIRTYFEYLTIFPFRNLDIKIKMNFFKSYKDGFIYDAKNTGIWFENQKERSIILNDKEYVKQEPTLNENKVNRYIKGVYTKKNLEALKEIVSICKKENINLILFTIPHNYNLMNNIDTNDYIYFLRELSKIRGFWDFGGYNSITMSNENYYDSSHYRPLIANLIASRIFHDKSVKVPSDFGVWVDKNNIEKHIADIKIQINKASIMYH